MFIESCNIRMDFWLDWEIIFIYLYRTRLIKKLKKVSIMIENISANLTQGLNMSGEMLEWVYRFHDSRVYIAGLNFYTTKNCQLGSIPHNYFRTVLCHYDKNNNSDMLEPYLSECLVFLPYCNLKDIRLLVCWKYSVAT